MSARLCMATSVSGWVGAAVLLVERPGPLDLLHGQCVFAQGAERRPQRQPQPGFDERPVLEAVHERQGLLDGPAEHRLLVRSMPRIRIHPAGRRGSRARRSRASPGSPPPAPRPPPWPAAPPRPARPPPAAPARPAPARGSCRRSRRPAPAARPRRPAPAPCSAARTSAAGTPPTAGTACTGSSARYRCTSAAKPLAVSYRRSRSFSRRLHHDPVQLAADQPRQPRRLRPPVGGQRRQAVGRAQPGARPRRLLLPDHPQHLQQRRPPPARFRSNGVVPVSSSYSSTPEGVDVAPGVDVQLVAARPAPGLMYSGVPTTAPNPVNSVLLGQRLAGRLGHPEVDHLRHRPAVVQGDQDVGRLEVAVDDPLLVGVLDRLADRHEQLQPLPRASAGARRSNSVIGTPLTSSMTKYGRPSGGRPGVEHLGDVRVVHQGQGLPLGLEPGQHLPASPCPA